jgi:ubiquinone/menaquinone biosynthesis C-methylase UbiE
MAKFNYYDRIAQNYDQTRWLTEPITELEAGVGTGVNVLPLVKRGYAVTGIDVSQEMLNQFRQKLPEAPSNAKFEIWTYKLKKL